MARNDSFSSTSVRGKEQGGEREISYLNFNFMHKHLEILGLLQMRKPRLLSINRAEMNRNRSDLKSRGHGS